jgi:hypothetical protein
LAEGKYYKWVDKLFIHLGNKLIDKKVTDFIINVAVDRQQIPQILHRDGFVLASPSNINVY